MKISELLTGPNKWVKRSEARNSSGSPVSARSADACRFCLTGACLKAHPRNSGRFELYLRLATAVRALFPERLDEGEFEAFSNEDVIIEFNDYDKTRFVDVQRVLAEAGL